jgi:hypothetical protein
MVFQTVHLAGSLTDELTVVRKDSVNRNNEIDDVTGRVNLVVELFFWMELKPGVLDAFLLEGFTSRFWIRNTVECNAW